MHDYTATWKEAGRLSRLETDFSSGVYLFVHEGPPKRVVYVGMTKQSSGFTHRWYQHLSLFETGGRTLWRPQRDADVYSLMKLSPEDQESYCKAGAIWIPSSKKVDGVFEPYYATAAGYLAGWKAWVLSEYLDKIAVWRCELPDDEASLILESRIQLAFKSEFDISYYRASANQSWLGRVEVPDAERCSAVRFAFEKLPDVEPKSRELLASLAD